MYGLVNKAIHELVVSKLGEQEWIAICQRARVDTTKFLELRSYPDEVTYALVGEVSRTMGVPASEILRGFGQHWVKFTGRAGHRDYFEAYPKNREGMLAFLDGLDDMHARMLTAMPHLRPPQIYCEAEGDQGVRVHYISERQGLAPMVTGLLEGLCEYFQVHGQVSYFAPDASASRSHDEFVIAFA